MLYVLPLRYLPIVTALVLSGCKLALNRELSSSAVATAALATSPSSFSALGITGGSDSTPDSRLYDGLVPTLTWADSTGETSYEVSVLDSTGTTTICGPVTVAADTTSYTFSSGCSLGLVLRSVETLG
jgi:hypothetical protein